MKRSILFLNSKVSKNPGVFISIKSTLLLTSGKGLPEKIVILWPRLIRASDKFFRYMP